MGHVGFIQCKMTNIEQAYLTKLQRGDVDFADSSIPILLTAGKSCHETVKTRPVSGIFASDSAAFTNGFVCVRLTNSLTSWGQVVFTEDCITIIVHIKDWTDLYDDLEQFATDDREKSTLLCDALGSDDDAYELFKRTLLKAAIDSHLSEVDPTSSIPSRSSHLVIDSAAACSCIIVDQPPSAPEVDRDEFLWFYDTLKKQGFNEFPTLSGISRFYCNKKSPHVRMVLQKRDSCIDVNLMDHVRTNNSLASVESIRQILVSKHGSKSVAEHLPAITEDLMVSIPHQIADAVMPASSSTFKCDEGIHHCIARLLLVDWEARLFECSKIPISVNELISCFNPNPTIIVKQRSWLLFHKDNASPIALNPSQVRYLLSCFSSVVLFDTNTNTAMRCSEEVVFRLSSTVANTTLSEIIQAYEFCKDVRPTKRLRQLLHIT